MKLSRTVAEKIQAVHGLAHVLKKWRAGAGQFRHGEAGGFHQLKGPLIERFGLLVVQDLRGGRNRRGLARGQRRGKRRRKRQCRDQG